MHKSNLGSHNEEQHSWCVHPQDNIGKKKSDKDLKYNQIYMNIAPDTEDNRIEDLIHLDYR